MGPLRASLPLGFHALDESRSHPGANLTELKPEPNPLALLNRSLVVTTLLAALIVAAAFWLGARNKDDDDWVRHSLEVRAQLVHILSLVQSAETGQGGYLLTGQDLYLGPYQRAIGQLPEALRRTRELVNDNPQQIENLAQLGQLIKDKLAELSATVDAYKAGHNDAALAIVNSDKGFRLMQEIRSAIEAMQAEEDRLLIARQAAAARSGMLLQAGVAIAFLLICAAGFMIARFTRGSFAALTAAHGRLALANRQLLDQVTRREAAESRAAPGTKDGGARPAHRRHRPRL